MEGESEREIGHRGRWVLREQESGQSAGLWMGGPVRPLGEEHCVAMSLSMSGLSPESEMVPWGSQASELPGSACQGRGPLTQVLQLAASFGLPES